MKCIAPFFGVSDDDCEEAARLYVDLISNVEIQHIEY